MLVVFGGSVWGRDIGGRRLEQTRSFFDGGSRLCSWFLYSFLPLIYGDDAALAYERWGAGQIEMDRLWKKPGELEDFDSSVVWCMRHA